MRGVYENPPGSGIWWVHYYAAGKRHREKVRRKSDAIKLYQSRKADVVALKEASRATQQQGYYLVGINR